MIHVVTADESSARDRAAIAGRIPSRALMRCAGAAAATVITQRYPEATRRGIAIYAGPGNNGGDAWVVASALAAVGLTVRLKTVGDPAPQGDAAAEREATLSGFSFALPNGSEGLIIDGLLGTGSRGALRETMAGAAREIRQYRDQGAIVVALDIPTGVDATTGAVDPGAVGADLTLTFGTLKRGLLIARSATGEIDVLDIGLGAYGDVATSDRGAPSSNAPSLIDAAFVAAHVPPIPADANKGTRGRVAIIAGGDGMAGAAIHAARAAVASGVGLVRLFVARHAIPVVQTAMYDGLAFAWPENDDDVFSQISGWADALLIGPGMGTSPPARAVVERVLRNTRCPTVVDADALNLFAGRVRDLGNALGQRPALITPHPGECARLVSSTTDDVLARRFDVGTDLAHTLLATVLLKGVPTVVTSPTGRRMVSASGTPVLATGGSGDLLGGMAVTLLAQTGDPFASAACAAWVHGRAAELVGVGIRGHTLDDVLRAFPEAWRVRESSPMYPVLAHLPRVGD